MIRTTKQVLISYNLKPKIGQVYLEVKNPSFDTDNDIVVVQAFAYYLEPTTVVVRNSDGSTSMVNANKKLPLLGRNGNSERPVTIPCIFKLSTWNSNFGTATKVDYDQLFINTIGFVNDREVNGTWTGQEKQQISWFAKPMTLVDGENTIELNGITVNDLEIVTPEMLTELNIIQ